MTIYQHRARKTSTGGTYHKLSKKKKAWLGSDFLPVHLKPTNAKHVRVLGGKTKMKLLSADKANIVDPSTGKTMPNVKILTVKENAANPNFVRMNIITQGAVIDTDAGLAKVTSRPGQHGVVNAILIKK